MAGFNANEIASKKYAGLGAELDFEIFRNIHLNLTANSFLIQEAGKRDSFSLFTGYGLGLGYLSIIGPVRAGIMYSADQCESIGSRVKGYVSIGYNF